MIPTQHGIRNLTIARDVLTELGVRYFLIDGTLLGLVREKNFIPHDKDLDIGVFAEDFTPLTFGLCVSKMMEQGFILQHCYGEWDKHFEAAWRRKDLKLDFFFYFKKENKRVFTAYKGNDVIEYWYPSSMIELLAPVSFLGETFTAPRDPEAVLRHKYGDWKTPDKNWDWAYSPLNVVKKI